MLFLPFCLLGRKQSIPYWVCLGPYLVLGATCYSNEQFHPDLLGGLFRFAQKILLRNQEHCNQHRAICGQSSWYVQNVYIKKDWSQDGPLRKVVSQLVFSTTGAIRSLQVEVPVLYKEHDEPGKILVKDDLQKLIE